MHVVHHPDYVAHPQPGQHSFSKYGAVMELLRADPALIEHRPEPCPRDWLEAAHDSAYVDQVLTCAVPRDIERRIGFAVTSDVSRRAQLSPGGTWLAARLALEHGYAANAAGGSHHALPDTGAGFCVFNDLAVAALRLLGEGTVARILIVDLDVHQGDGTATILAGRDDIMTLSLHAEKNFPARKARSTMDVGLPDGLDDAGYLDALRPALDAMIARNRPQLILYQAGVDVHRDDKLGRLALSDNGIAARDTMVAEAAKRRGIPLASVMGGGYGDDVVTVAARHAAVIRTLAAVLG
ncbi:Histone deacetylase domain-containing protein [Sphingomonas antarctica]|uniref:histone deacetylase family protein n=1 Tax=Sphingomonas antarctica TaxID=2040274 RepID=UPI0039E96C6C